MIGIESLRHKVLFLGLADTQLSAVAALVRTRAYRPGEIVVRRGSQDDAIYIIERGSVELRVPDERGVERVVGVIEKGDTVDGAYTGDFFGELALVDLEPWGATVATRERTVLHEIKRDDLYDLFAKDVDLRIGVVLNVARALSRRLRARNAERGDA